MGYINLIYGFEKGNKVLETVRKRLERHIRDVDMLAKTGGDEFTIFIELSKEENAWAIAEKLYRLFIHPIENISVFINASISIFPIDGKTFTELFEKVGRTLKKQKEGPKVIKFYTFIFEKDIFEKEVSDLLKVKALIEKAIKMTFLHFIIIQFLMLEI